MLVNLGSERIMMVLGNESIVLPFEHVEEHLTSQLITYYTNTLPDKLYIVNGPGSFTNLRVGVLVANLMQRLSGGKLSIMTIDKLQFFRYLYLQQVLPQYGYLYFGQRRKFWLMNVETMTYDVIASYDADQLVYGPHYFVDRFVGDDFPQFAKQSYELQFIFRDNRLFVSYHTIEIDVTDIFEAVETLEPSYAMELEFKKKGGTDT